MLILCFIFNIFSKCFAVSVYKVKRDYVWHAIQETLFFFDFASIFTTWLTPTWFREAEPSHFSISLIPPSCRFVYCAFVDALIPCLWHGNWAGLRPDWHRALPLKWAFMTRGTGGPCVVYFLSIRHEDCLMDDSIETPLLIECDAWQESLVYP